MDLGEMLKKNEDEEIVNYARKPLPETYKSNKQ